MKLIIVILFTFGLTGCESLTKSFLKDPEVNVVEVKVVNINMSDISFAVTLNVKNPNGLELSLGKVTYELNLSGETVTEGTFSEGFKVPAFGQNNVIVPLKFKFKSVGNILSGIINRSFTKEYELKGTAQLGIFSIPFSKKGKVNINN